MEKSNTIAGNPDITFPPQTGSHMPYSQDGLINRWKEIPTSGNYIMTVKNGEISFLPASSGSLQLLNNSLQWTDTENCT
jgi:hypothetical protein